MRIPDLPGNFRGRVDLVVEVVEEGVFVVRELTEGFVLLDGGDGRWGDSRCRRRLCCCVDSCFEAALEVGDERNETGVTGVERGHQL